MAITEPADTNKTDEPALADRVILTRDKCKKRTIATFLREWSGFQKIGLSTIAVAEQFSIWTKLTQCPTVQTHPRHCIQENLAHNEPVVYHKSYPFNSCLLRHARGQSVAEF